MKKYLLFLLIFIGLGAACSSLPSIILKFQERRYRPCTDAEVSKHLPESEAPIKFCWRYCATYRTWRRHTSNNCKFWKTETLSTQEDFLKLRAGGFVLINEKRIY